VLLLDPVAAAGPDGAARTGTPLDSFMPERGIVHVEPMT
jgi:hypothetical protein